MIMAGAEVTAVDVSAGRIKRLNENLSRLRLNAKIVCADARNGGKAKNSVRKSLTPFCLTRRVPRRELCGAIPTLPGTERRGTLTV